MEFLLVHGSTQAPCGWDLLIVELEARGHRCLAVDLHEIQDWSPERFGREISRQAEDFCGGVVVAHSISGLVLPEIARAVHASLQVWLSAWIPDGLLSMSDEIGSHAGAIFNDAWFGVDPNSDSELARHFLFHDCEPTVVRWAINTLRSFFPVDRYSKVVSLATEIPSSAIVPLHDRTLRSEWMLRSCVERLATIPIEVDGGHCPHVSRPALIAEILSGLT
jgi:hypothetical protein